MRVVIFGDIHGYVPGFDILTIDLVRRVVDLLEVDVILQVGDMCSYNPFSKPVYWIYGNRDSIRMINALEKGTVDIKNLIHIRTGEVLTFLAPGEKLTVSGLNGAYEPIYYDYNREELGEEGLGCFTASDVKKCLELRNIDIFLVHGCPAGLGFGREPDHGVPAISQILEEVRPRYMFCGHAHFFHKAEYKGCKVYSLELANREYYVLDTASDQLEVIGINPGALFPQGNTLSS